MRTGPVTIFIFLRSPLCSYSTDNGLCRRATTLKYRRWQLICVLPWLCNSFALLDTCSQPPLRVPTRARGEWPTRRVSSEARHGLAARRSLSFRTARDRSAPVTERGDTNGETPLDPNAALRCEAASDDARCGADVDGQSRMWCRAGLSHVSLTGELAPPVKHTVGGCWKVVGAMLVLVPLTVGGST